MDETPSPYGSAGYQGNATYRRESPPTPPTEAEWRWREHKGWHPSQDNSRRGLVLPETRKGWWRKHLKR